MGVAHQETWPPDDQGRRVQGETMPGARSYRSSRPATSKKGVSHEPERFDIRRTPNDHRPCFGAHLCWGNRLARME